MLRNKRDARNIRGKNVVCVCVCGWAQKQKRGHTTTHTHRVRHHTHTTTHTPHTIHHTPYTPNTPHTHNTHTTHTQHTTHTTWRRSRPYYVIPPRYGPALGVLSPYLGRDRVLPGFIISVCRPSVTHVIITHSL